MIRVETVSYTHLDVYKRQEMKNDNFAIAGTLICDDPSKQVKKKD